MLDGAAFPAAKAYLDQLPDGIRSYPQCRVRPHVPLRIAEEFPDLIEQAGLSAEVKAIPSAREAWFPEVHANVLNLMAMDGIFESKRRWLQWSYDLSMEVFKRPMYRVIMFVMSPTLVAMGASKRWSTFREGTDLSPGKTTGSEGGVSTSRSTLTFPDHHYNQALLDGLNAGFRAAITAAGGKQVVASSRMTSPREATVEVSWAKT